MVKRTLKKSKTPVSKYKPFVLYGKYNKKWAALYLLIDLCIGFTLGFMLQPLIVAALTNYATGLFAH